MPHVKSFTMSLFFLFMVILLFQPIKSAAKPTRSRKITYFSFERPLVTYLDTVYIEYLNLTTTRIKRNDPIHYMNMIVKIVKTFPIDTKMDVLFYEFLSNTYRRTFVEMYFDWCDLIKMKHVFGTLAREAKIACPTVPNTYSFHRRYFPVDSIAKYFPFNKGRIFVNVRILQHYVAKMHVDFELKEVDAKRVTAIENNNINVNASGYYSYISQIPKS